jgi:multicomponent Na+:H+ antiporter subunit B
LYLIAEGPEQMLKALRTHPTILLSIGLVLALTAGVLPWFQGLPFMTGLWGKIPVGWGEPIKQGTPLLFDVGVFFVVVGFTLTIVLSLEEEN